MIYVKRMFLMVFVTSSCSLPPSLLFLAPVFHVCQVLQVQHLQIVLEPGFTVDGREGSLHLFVHLQNNVGLLHPETRDAR